MEYGHWELLCDEIEDMKAFVYLIVSSEGRRYLGAKTCTSRWERYKGSSKKLKDARARGVTFSYYMLYQFSAEQQAFDVEHILLTTMELNHNTEYYNVSTSKFNYDSVTPPKRFGSENPAWKGWWVIDNTVYESISASTAEALGVTKSILRNRCLKPHLYPGYWFQPKESGYPVIPNMD